MQTPLKRVLQGACMCTTSMEPPCKLLGLLVSPKQTLFTGICMQAQGVAQNPHATPMQTIFHRGFQPTLMQAPLKGA